MHFSPSWNFNITILLWLADKQFDGLFVDIEILSYDEKKGKRCRPCWDFKLLEGQGGSEGLWGMLAEEDTHEDRVVSQLDNFVKEVSSELLP